MKKYTILNSPTYLAFFFLSLCLSFLNFEFAGTILKFRKLLFLEKLLIPPGFACGVGS